MRVPVLLICALTALAGGLPVAADGVVALRTIRARAVIAASDVALSADAAADAASDPADVIGREARVAIFAGQPVPTSALADPALIERNQMVPLVFRRGGLEIRAEGRALDRAATGATLRAMNLSSRAIVTGRVAPDGSVAVAELP